MDARDLELTQSCTGPHQNGSTRTNDPRDTPLADGDAGSPAPPANVPAGEGVSSVGRRRVQVQQLPPTIEEREAIPDFFSPPTSQLDPRAENGDPPGIQRPIGDENQFLATPLQMMNFDEGLRTRFASTEARVRSGIGLDAEEQTASAERGPSENEILKQTVARLERLLLLQAQQSQPPQGQQFQGHQQVQQSFSPPGWNQGPHFGAYGSTPFGGYGHYPGAQFGFTGYGHPGQAETNFRQEQLGMRYKPVEVTRITVDPIKRANVAEIKTSLYVFARLLDQVHLRDACNGVGTTSPEMCRDLRNIVNKWVKADADVVDHIISTFGVDCECTGKELFDSVKMAFMDILVNEKVDC